MPIRLIAALALAHALLAGCAPAVDRPTQGGRDGAARASPQGTTGTETCVRGRLTAEGVECQAMRGADGRLYTLIGDLAGLGARAASGEACICGRVAELSSCMQGTTVVVERMGPPESCP